MRDREMKKVLFRPIENGGDKPASPDTVAEDTEVEDSCQVREMFVFQHRQKTRFVEVSKTTIWAF